MVCHANHNFKKTNNYSMQNEKKIKALFPNVVYILLNRIVEYILINRNQMCFTQKNPLMIENSTEDQFFIFNYRSWYVTQ